MRRESVGYISFFVCLFVFYTYCKTVSYNLLIVQDLKAFSPKNTFSVKWSESIEVVRLQTTIIRKYTTTCCKCIKQS